MKPPIHNSICGMCMLEDAFPDILGRMSGWFLREMQ